MAVGDREHMEAKQLAYQEELMKQVPQASSPNKFSLIESQPWERKREEILLQESGTFICNR